MHWGQLSMCSFLNRFSLWGIFTLFCGIYFFILLSLHLKPCCCLLFFSYLKVWHDANVGFLYTFLFQTSFQTIKTLIDEPQKRKIGSANDSNLLDRESNCCVRVLWSDCTCWLSRLFLTQCLKACVCLFSTLDAYRCREEISSGERPVLGLRW